MDQYTFLNVWVNNINVAVCKRDLHYTQIANGGTSSQQQLQPPMMAPLPNDDQVVWYDGDRYDKTSDDTHFPTKISTIRTICLPMCGDMWSLLWNFRPHSPKVSIASTPQLGYI